MVKKFEIDSLIIEVTRKCNAKCEMCLRGDCEQKDMNMKYVRKLLSSVSSVNTITFSGGEPTLNVEIIKDTLEYVRKHNIPVYSVYVVTNGIKYSQELVDYMYDWLLYCMGYQSFDDIDIEDLSHRGNIVKDYVENSCFGLSLSIDDFHPLPSVESLVKYRSLVFYSTAKEHEVSDTSFVITEGRALENGLGRDYLRDYSYRWSNNDDNIIDELYLNVNGNIYPCCDFSFETQDNVIGNVNIMERTINQIINDKDVHYDYENYEDDIAV